MGIWSKMSEVITQVEDHVAGGVMGHKTQTVSTNVNAERKWGPH